MQNRLPLPDQTPGQSLRSHYQRNQQFFRARIESGEDPEAVRESMLMNSDLVTAVTEAAIEDAVDGVSAPDQAVEKAMAEFPAFPSPREN